MWGCCLCPVTQRGTALISASCCLPAASCGGHQPPGQLGPVPLSPGGSHGWEQEKKAALGLGKLLSGYPGAPWGPVSWKR